MSKSTGDFLRLETLKERKISPLVYRYFCMTAHYRTQMSFSWDSLKASQTALNRLYQTAYGWGSPGAVIPEVIAAFEAEVNNDLNFPRALAVVWELVKSNAKAADKKATLLKLDDWLGLDIDQWVPAEQEIPDAVSALVAAREQARKDKDYAAADQLRRDIEIQGFSLEDTRDGPKVSVKTD